MKEETKYQLYLIAGLLVIALLKPLNRLTHNAEDDEGDG